MKKISDDKINNDSKLNSEKSNLQNELLRTNDEQQHTIFDLENSIRKLTDDINYCSNINNKLVDEKEKLLLELDDKNKLICDLKEFVSPILSNQNNYDIIRDENAWLLKQLTILKNKYENAYENNLTNENTIKDIKDQ